MGATLLLVSATLLPFFSVRKGPSCSSIHYNSRARACAEDKKLSSFKTWLSSKGLVHKHVRVERGSKGHGLFAEGNISQGDVIVSVPKNVWMSLPAAMASEIGAYCEGKRPWICIALFLLHERSKPNSIWGPYIDILPHRLDSPLFWSNDELTELRGTQLLESTLGYKQYIGNEYQQLQGTFLSNPQIFDAQVFTQEAFLWAFGTLRSRMFPPLIGDDLALVPFADMINHGFMSTGNESSWERRTSGFLSRSETLAVRASASFKVGEEVVMQYGKKKSNSQLALDYGFIEKDEEDRALRDGYTLTLEIPESDCFFGDKLDIAELNGLSVTMCFDITRNQVLPENMLAFLRLIALSGPDAFLLEALFRNSVWEHLQLPVSRENEEAVCRAILDGCSSALAGYGTTIAEDFDLLKSNELSPRLEIAAVVRAGEKCVLQELRLQFEVQMGKLDELEYYAQRRLKNLGLLDETGSVTPWIFND